MNEYTLQRALEEQRQQLVRLENFRAGPSQGKALSRALSALRQSMAELQTLAASSDLSVQTYANDATEGISRQEFRRYQERLRALMADLLLAEERERHRLAVDLHDGLSQTIALTQIKLSALRLSLRGKLADSLDGIEALIAQIDRDIRSISFELSPPVLHDLGLEPAVQWLVENIQERYAMEIVLDLDGHPKPADEKSRVILFRSLRELLINAAKHSKARRIHVRLEREEDRLNATVEDDGIGMEADIVAVRGSGLFSIRERLSHVGGSMSIESAPGRGTKVRLCAPLASAGPSNAQVEK